MNTQITAEKQGGKGNKIKRDIIREKKNAPVLQLSLFGFSHALAIWDTGLSPKTGSHDHTIKKVVQPERDRGLLLQYFINLINKDQLNEWCSVCIFLLHFCYCLIVNIRGTQRKEVFY